MNCTRSTASEKIEWVSARDAPAVERAPGFRIRDLWRGAKGGRAQLAEIAPGARYPGLELHAPGPEEVFVVSGVFHDGTREYPAGSFIHNPAGSSHEPQSAEGCTLFLFYPEG
jgi:anti-sigma factor ChrR (cupin superfamily)